MSINNIELFRAKIAKGGICIGTPVSFSDPAISELFGDAGCDFTWIDMEHCPIDLHTALGHVMALRGTNAAPLIRVLSGDPNVIKPVLELHPAGIVVPQVRSAAEVATVVAACKYPPAGIRGFGPRRGRAFGGMSYPEYLRDADDQIMVLVQIEHIDAARDLDAILAIRGLDGICIGFNDLAGSMGLAGQPGHPQVLALAEEVVCRTRQTAKYAGVAMGFDLPMIRHWREVGVQWFSLGGDFGLLYGAARSMLDQLRDL
ncbi:MAG: 4-hydroxy-3-methylbut-2-en-1-yl diphosphate synthase [Candidatus Handelsmanbacteria bacterium]|nr:4-hydroxy-3-methylbut-2-en-1-yl diphosphate synthase [Candidatus Handelsmanbacteria bacterium]